MSYGREEHVRASYNRQSRRVALCIKARPRRRTSKLAMSRRGVVLTAYGHDMARLAASIADELQLSGNSIDRLLWPYGHALERTEQMSSGGVAGS